MKSKQITLMREDNNVMRKIKIEKVILSCGAVGLDLEKAVKLLELLSRRKVQKIASTKRIPTFGVRPGLEVGARVTIRGKEAEEILRNLLGAVNNVLREKQIVTNGFSFGIKEYIEIPGIEYKREIGIRGFNTTVAFTRAGVRVKRKKLKRGKLPKKQYVSQEEIIAYMEEKFGTKIE